MYRVSTLLVAAGMSLGAISSGFAADLPMLRKAPPAPPAPTWTGFYFGAHVGAGFGTTEATANFGPLLGGLGAGAVTANIPIVSQTFNGFLGGGQVGYNWQASSVVFGIEGDGTWANLEGNAPCVLILACNVKHDWLADVTGRLGVVAFDKALLYVKGGVAWVDAKYSAGNSFSAGAATIAINATANQVRVGGLLGMGVEYGFMPNWSAKLEYNFIDLGKDTLNFAVTTVPPVAIPPIPVEMNDFVHVFKAGVNYHL